MEVTTNPTAEDARQARAAEYGKYKATEPIHIDGALAFNPGDPVPIGHVKQFHLDDAVELQNAKPSATPVKKTAARKATAKKAAAKQQSAPPADNPPANP